MIRIGANAWGSWVDVHIGDSVVRMPIEDAKDLPERLATTLSQAIETASKNKRYELAAEKKNVLARIEQIDRELVELFPEGFPEITGAANAMNTN